MKELILFAGMTVSLVFLFTQHIQFKKIRERISERREMNEDLDRNNYLTLFLCKFFTCDYCCGFWCGVVSFVCVTYCTPINYLFTGAIVSFLIFNKE